MIVNMFFYMKTNEISGKRVIMLSLSRIEWIFGEVLTLVVASLRLLTRLSVEAHH